MVLKVSLVLFFLVCGSCHAGWLSVFGGSTQAPKTSTSTIPSVTEPPPSSSIDAKVVSKGNGLSDINMFFDEPESSSGLSNTINMNASISSGIDDSGLVLDGGESSLVTFENSRRAINESTSTTSEYDLPKNDTMIPEERDLETTTTASSETETTTATTYATTSPSSTESKIIRAITSTSAQPSTTTTTSEAAISSSSTTQEPTTTTTTTTEATTAVKIETSTEIKSSDSINRRSCQGLNCDDTASEESEPLNKFEASSTSSSGSSVPSSSSSMISNEDTATTLPNFTGSDEERSAEEVQNITVIAEPTKNGSNSPRDVNTDDSKDKVSSTKKPSTSTVNPNKKPMSSSGLIVAPADKVSFLLLSVTFFLSMIATSTAF